MHCAFLFSGRNSRALLSHPLHLPPTWRETAWKIISFKGEISVHTVHVLKVKLSIEYILHGLLWDILWHLQISVVSLCKEPFPWHILKLSGDNTWQINSQKSTLTVVQNLSRVFWTLSKLNFNSLYSKFYSSLLFNSV